MSKNDLRAKADKLAAVSALLPEEPTAAFEVLLGLLATSAVFAEMSDDVVIASVAAMLHAMRELVQRNPPSVA